MSVSSVKKPKKMYFRFMGKSYRISDTIIGYTFLLPALNTGHNLHYYADSHIFSLCITDANLLKLNQVNFVGLKNFEFLI